MRVVVDRWEVVITSPDRVRRVPYGPAGDWLPARLTAVVDYAEQPLRVRIAASFDGINRVRADRVSVERTDGASVTPEDMTALRLASLMGSIVWHATRREPGGDVFEMGRSRGGPPTEKELRTVAWLYWFEYVSWGSPRQAIMAAFGLPRSTANRWIRKAREMYDLPGPHADDEEA